VAAGATLCAQIQRLGLSLLCADLHLYIFDCFVTLRGGFRMQNNRKITGTIDRKKKQFIHSEIRNTQSRKTMQHNAATPTQHLEKTVQHNAATPTPPACIVS
jgi:hypothetical protein